MPIVIRRVKEPKTGLAYVDWPIIEINATPAQEARIAALQRENIGLSVVPHHQRGKHEADALIALTSAKAIWISPKGRVTPAESPNPCCWGNPTTAHCIAEGYCRRSPACNE